MRNSEEREQNDTTDHRRNRAGRKRAAAGAGADLDRVVLDRVAVCVGCGHHASGPVGALRDKQGNAVGSDATDKRLAASA